MVDRSFLFINFRSICTLSGAQTFWDTLYRAEMADKLMNPGDPEPGHLYSADVLKRAKAEYKKAGLVDKEVFRVLEILKFTDLKNTMQILAVVPFYVHYWSHHQLDVWRNYCKRGDACICIDATGGIVRKIERLDKTKTKTIFLYEGVVNTGTGQFSVAQMITESHNTNNIHHWLAEWVRSGAPIPKEVVSDSAIALLAAAIRTFTGFTNIDEYANACTDIIVPKCYIRIDVAHFIKMYANVLKMIRPRIKKFHLACIGQLILSANKHEAEERLTWILTVCLSETEGARVNDAQDRAEETYQNHGSTACEIAKKKLQQLITGSSNDEMETIISLYIFISIFIHENNDFTNFSIKKFLSDL